jgi:hypothetical protein
MSIARERLKTERKQWRKEHPYVSATLHHRRSRCTHREYLSNIALAPALFGVVF